MKCRYIVLIIVAAVILIGIPAVIAACNGLYYQDGESITALVIYPSESEDDPYTLEVINGAFSASKYSDDTNKSINVYLYPSAGTGEDTNNLLNELRNTVYSKKPYNTVIVTGQQNVLDPELVSKEFPDITFVYLDSGIAWEEGWDNIQLFDFKGEESAFLAGYIAGMKTDTNIVGFIAGDESAPTNRLRYGFEAGVRYAAADSGKDIECKVRTIELLTVEDFAEGITPQKRGAATALELYGAGADIIMAAAGAYGNGVISAAEETGRDVIGCDKDMSYYAPNNVLCSATKSVYMLVYYILTQDLDIYPELKNKNVSDMSNEEKEHYLERTFRNEYYKSISTEGNHELGLAYDCVDVEGWHTSIDYLKTDVDKLREGIEKGVVPIPYSAETMKTWSVVRITDNQAPLIKSGSSAGVSI